MYRVSTFGGRVRARTRLIWLQNSSIGRLFGFGQLCSARIEWRDFGEDSEPSTEAFDEVNGGGWSLTGAILESIYMNEPMWTDLRRLRYKWLRYKKRNWCRKPNYWANISIYLMRKDKLGNGKKIMDSELPKLYLKQPIRSIMWLCLRSAEYYALFTWLLSGQLYLSIYKNVGKSQYYKIYFHSRYLCKMVVY